MWRRAGTMTQQAALLIGKIAHARKEWEALAKIAELKVYHIAHQLQV
jgi:hypothetical protein